MLDRHTKILELLTENKKIEVTKLSELLNVSQVTIRKDLIQLENKGLIVREHGFATLNSSDDINNRLAYHYEIKRRIAKLATESVMDGETIMIESGSCCALLALEIAQTKKDITIITNSAFIADYIRKLSNTRIILLGGEYQNESQVMVGPITRKCVESFFVDKLFIGTDGFSEVSGFTGKDYMRSETVRDMAKQANHVIIVTESTKFSQKGVVNLIATDEISSVVTDVNIPKECEEYLFSKNIEVKKVEY
ncbi:DeoR/GlpR family DNA-binding transcription regulator [Clostridium botulinum]|uniref:Lactose phosphotransferase system repressor n=1 Tax=Clostridium botulinum TaxID=1491 RepID=A0A846J7V5_CLOBO|nr:DeoR/GlpR family DNA-binding transcription regulator [Clostridium botulinum]NFH66016.1 DeoR/GlpR transcriptional regulator [Clostridium botulinum]NFJ09979.1 DeoR/GlpR transcriptional regulator [Clostridium botulinum]NFK15780.1 DeoR/GlpR transcriptional regulator [Clostridium botulinum]NFM94078.1 DeoR/GlpR transcriptional regulator [Clostridium botulinum]NFO17681.1 DeoR/GlpR transcriptional regulator [Clostridium botulinum]